MRDSCANQHVFLTPVSLTPRGEGERCMYVCDRVQESVIRRSAVLSALQETSGVVQLPRGISVRAFSIWKKAADGGTEPSVAELSTVVKIGHQLADVHISQWVRLLAEKAVATDWNSEKTRDTMQSALLDMPPHVQQLVFREALCLRGADSLLQAIPITLHPSAISALVDTGGTLAATISRDPGLFLAHLRVIDTPQRGLRALNLANSPQLLAARSNTIMLGKCLGFHSKLESFNISNTGLVDSTFTILAPMLRQMSMLTSLMMDQASLSGASIPTLHGVLRQLPNLSNLSLGSLRLPDRLLIRAAASYPLTEALAAAPALSHLRLTGTHLHSSALSTLLHLRHLELDQARPYSPEVPPMLSAIRAPNLTQLHLTVDTLRIATNAPADTPAITRSMRSMLGALTQFTSMQKLHLSIASCEDLSSEAHKTLADSLQRLPVLQSLHIVITSLYDVVEYLPAYLTTTSMLTSLCFDGSEEEEENLDRLVDWQPFFVALERHKGLKELQLPFTGDQGEKLYHVLSRLNSLTLLSLEMPPNADYSSRPEMDCSTLSPALLSLPNLLSLKLRHMELEERSRLWEVIPALTQLTTLVMDSASIHMEDAAPLANALANLQGLKTLDLNNNYLAERMREVAQAVLQLPVIQYVDMAENDCSGEDVIWAGKVAKDRGVRMQL